MSASDANPGNLADTNSDEYKHEHGGHHHHHHHHRHHHRHFHFLNFSLSGIRDNLKLIFGSLYTYPYILLFLSLVFLFLMSSGAALSLLASCKKSFSTMMDYYRWQEYLVLNKTFLIRIPFQFTLVASAFIALFLRQRQERHWQRNVLKLLPALIASAVFSFSVGSGRPQEEFARSACRDCLRQYQAFCMEFARSNNGLFPEELPDRPSPAAEYDSTHYIYYGAGRNAADSAFLLLEDMDESHVGNCRYAIRSDGMLLVSKYGGLYQEYTGKKQASAN